MQTAPSYYNVVGQVHRFLRARIEVCRSAGIAAEHIVIDPGFGFGKTLTHNLSLLVALRSFADLGYPVMAGLSRKSMLGVITDRDVADRLPASVAAAVIAAQQGASILRVHDVAATVDAVAVMRLVNATRAAAPKYPQLM
nr:dihydropteroate synthase [Mycolicibacterium wolinskyi]